MINFDQAVSIIRRNGGFKPNRKDTSYYRTYTIEGNRPLQARVSNHGTWLRTWYDKDYDPSYAMLLISVLCFLKMVNMILMRL